MTGAALIVAVIGALLLLGIVGAAAAIFLRRRNPKHRIDPAEALEAFNQQRKSLQELLLATAGASGRPRGLRWLACDFRGDPLLARERQSGDLWALVTVEVRFEAIEGGDMEDNPNVATVRSATGVFRRRQGEWTTDGRVVFNLGPAETLTQFEHELEGLNTIAPNSR